MTKLIYQFAQFLRRFGVDFHEENDPRVRAMQDAIKKINGIQFQIEVSSDGSWIAESTNIDGIITGGTNRDRINEVIKDAVFTYFEIPPQLCNDNLVNTSNESVTLKQSVYA